MFIALVVTVVQMVSAHDIYIMHCVSSSFIGLGKRRTVFSHECSQKQFVHVSLLYFFAIETLNLLLTLDFRYLNLKIRVVFIQEKWCSHTKEGTFKMVKFAGR